MNLISGRSKHSGFNIVLVGDHNVGKTEILKAYLGHYFTKFDSQSWNAIDNSLTKETNVDGINYKMYLWEWSSSSCSNSDNIVERNINNSNSNAFVTSDNAVLQSADCFLLCYALNNANSFKNIEIKWIPQIRAEAPKTPIILVGTKLDLKNCYGATRVSDLKVQKMKFRTKAMSVVECSAKTLQGIPQVFKDALICASQNQDPGCSIM